MNTAKHDGTAPSILTAMRQAAEALQQTDNPFLAEKFDDQVGEYYRAICGLKDDDALEAAGDAHADLKRRREQEQHEARLRRERRDAIQAKQASGFSEWDRRTRIAAGDRPGEEDRSP